MPLLYFCARSADISSSGNPIEWTDMKQQLADLIGVTYQQAHKYERGINRVSAGRLYEIAQVLSVPVGYFFDGLQEENTRAVSPRERMCLELARNFAQIPNERHQEALSQLARVLAAD